MSNGPEMLKGPEHVSRVSNSKSNEVMHTVNPFIKHDVGGWSFNWYIVLQTGFKLLHLVGGLRPDIKF